MEAESAIARAQREAAATVARCARTDYRSVDREDSVGHVEAAAALDGAGKLAAELPHPDVAGDILLCGLHRGIVADAVTRPTSALSAKSGDAGAARVARDSAVATVGPVDVGVHTRRIAPGHSARALAAAGLAGLSRAADHVAGAAVRFVGQDVHARRTAERESGVRAPAGPADAALARLTGHAAASAVGEVDGDVDATLRANREVTLAAAYPVGAHLPAHTLGVAVATVPPVEQRIGAVGIAPDVSGSGAHAGSADARSWSGTRSVAGAAMVRAGVEIHTCLAANCSIAGASAHAIKTTIARTTSVVARAAVSCAGLQVGTDGAADGHRSRAHTSARVAGLPGGARRITRPAVARVRFEVGAIAATQL